MRKTALSQAAANAKACHNTAATELMEFFYSVHYQIGTTLEDVVRAGMLSRQQAAILWLIRSEGGPAAQMRRKDIEMNVRRWFEVTNAAVSKSLRALMHEPHALIEITEDPRSGREKLVALTPKGQAFIDAAAKQAAAMLAKLIEDAPHEVVDNAITYFRHLTSGFERALAGEQSGYLQPDRRSNRVSIKIAERKSARG